MVDDFNVLSMNCTNLEMRSLENAFTTLETIILLALFQYFVELIRY